MISCRLNAQTSKWIFRKFDEAQKLFQLMGKQIVMQMGKGGKAWVKMWAIHACDKSLQTFEAELARGD